MPFAHSTSHLALNSCKVSSPARSIQAHLDQIYTATVFMLHKPLKYTNISPLFLEVHFFMLKIHNRSRKQEKLAQKKCSEHYVVRIKTFSYTICDELAMHMAFFSIDTIFQGTEIKSLVFTKKECGNMIQCTKTSHIQNLKQIGKQL